MKYANQEMLQNAFLKVFVAGSPHRVYFRDVRIYKKYSKRIAPHLPSYVEGCTPSRNHKDDHDDGCRLA